jgi:hypothetical protein
VHAHVSALKRRKYSYLLEQDGRGNDYGITIEKKLSVNNFYPKKGKVSKFRLLIKRLFLNYDEFELIADPISVNFLIAMLDQDFKCGFEKFLGLEKQISHFNHLCLNAVSKLP